MALLGPFLGQDQGKTGAKYAELKSSHQDSEGIELLGILAAMSEGGGVGVGIGSSDQAVTPRTQNSSGTRVWELDLSLLFLESPA